MIHVYSIAISWLPLLVCGVARCLKILILAIDSTHHNADWNCGMMTGTMSNPLLPELAHLETPVIGMVHLLPLSGSPGYQGDPHLIEKAMLRDAEALVNGGVAALCLENYGDVPFCPDAVPSVVVSHMTALAAKLRSRLSSIPLGINVLRNDGCAALSIAHIVGAEFVRVNILCGARVTDQGMMQGIAHRLMRLRKQLIADQIRVFADVNSKHSRGLGDRVLQDEVRDIIHRGLADAVIVTGTRTGQPVNVDELESVCEAAGTTPVLVGSGVTIESIRALAAVADGLIVGTAFKPNGVLDCPVDVHRVRKLMDCL